MPTQWVASTNGFSGVNNIAQASGALQLIELVGAADAVTFDPPAIDRFTVLRIRGRLLWEWNSAAVAPAVAVIFMGIALVTQTSAAAAAGPDPSLAADGGSGNWLWLHSTSLTLNTVATLTGCNPSDVTVDVRVKRRMKEGQQLVLMTKSSFNGGTTMQLFTQLRTLIGRVA